MAFIDHKCRFEVLTEDVLNECVPFTCGEDNDMDEFFHKDALVYIPAILLHALAAGKCEDDSMLMTINPQLAKFPF